MIILLVLLLNACQENNNPLNPEQPISITVWHYYNGHLKEKFDDLVVRFNETEGIKKGIVVDAQSQGDVEQLAIAVFDAANGSIGALEMPDIFASYPDNAFRVNQLLSLVNFETYFTDQEMSSYRQEFLEEGQFFGDDKTYILPIAKSTENLYVNKTIWDDFSSKHGFKENDLQTWEGLYRVSKVYFEETGQAFFGIDANANFMLQAGMQLGRELFTYSEDGSVSFNMSKDVAKKIWDYFYRPYIQGYFVKTGRFSSDDARTETVIAYTGSTAGASYFPTHVTRDNNQAYAIEPLILPYPYFENGLPYAIQQGAGMCISSSEYHREYAAAEFLKWFTDIDQNIEFSISTGYFPVKNEALDEKLMLGELDQVQSSIPSLVASIQATQEMFRTYSFYNNKPFEGSFDMRNLLENHLFDRVKSNLNALKLISDAESREKRIDELISETSFLNWYQQILEEADIILGN